MEHLIIIPITNLSLTIKHQNKQFLTLKNLNRLNFVLKKIYNIFSSLFINLNNAVIKSLFFHYLILKQ